MKPLITIMCIACLAMLPPLADAQDHAAGHLLVAPSDVKWSPGPASLPPGAEIAIIEGDPAKEGPLTIRLKFPADYAVAPHTHPVTEQLTVLKGSIALGVGKKMDKKAAKHLSAGGYSMMPKEMPHYAWTTEPTVIQLNSSGPWGITYVNKKDDPREKKMGSN